MSLFENFQASRCLRANQQYRACLRLSSIIIRIQVFLLANDHCLTAKLRTQALGKHVLSLIRKQREKIWRRRAPVEHLIDREVLFPRLSMSQNRGFTRGFVAIERFLILMINSKKSGPNDCVVIRRLSKLRGVAIARLHWYSLTRCHYLFINALVFFIHDTLAALDLNKQCDQVP